MSDWKLVGGDGAEYPLSPDALVLTRASNGWVLYTPGASLWGDTDDRVVLTVLEVDDDVPEPAARQAWADGLSRALWEWDWDMAKALGALVREVEGE